MLKKREIKIAIVEDNEFFNKSLLKYIQTICDPNIYKDHEFTITTFSTANDAIQELDNELDIIILDYFLIDPDADDYLNGADVLAEVVKHCANCRVILVSGYSEKLNEFELRRKGVHEFVDKKVNSNNRIGSLIQHSLLHELRA